MSPRLASLLTKIQPAGVILFARNITGAEQTHTLLRECQKCVATPLFTCVDLEGGTVDRFRNVIGRTPSPAEVFATGSRALFRKHGRVIGENCRALGFNVDFAPVLDLAYEASRSVLSSRAVSDDPKQVVAYAREFLRGLGDAGVLGCGKHFPGLGEATLDTHHELPSVEKPLRKMWDEDLVPYRRYRLRRELPFVMVSHAAFPAVTKDANSGIALEEMDHRHSAQEDWLPRPDLFRRSGDGRRAGGGPDRTGRDRTSNDRAHPRRGRSWPDLPSGRFHSAGARGHGPRSGARCADLPAACGNRQRRVLAFKLAIKEKAFDKKSAAGRRTPAPTSARVEKLTRQLWEFGEEIRLATLARSGGERA